MNYLVKTSFLLLIVVPVFFLSCEKERALLNPHDSKTDPDFWAPSELKSEQPEIGNQIEFLKVQLSWKDNAKNEDGYVIDRKKGEGSWKQVGTVQGDITQWIDTTHQLKVKNEYSAHAIASKNQSSSVSSSITPIIPEPSDMKVVQEKVNVLKVEWADRSIGEDGFVIDRTIGENNIEPKIAWVGENVTIWRDTIDVEQYIASPTTVYKYSVQTYHTTSSNSNIGSDKITSSVTITPPDAPETVDVISVEYNLEEMTVTWDALSDNDSLSYFLMYSNASVGIKETIKEIIDRSVTTHVLTEFDPTTPNWYWIKVVDFWEREFVGLGKSNEIDPLPTAVNVTSVNYDKNEMVISWEKSADEDFKSYDLLLNDVLSNSITTITDISDTSHVLTDFDPTKENIFWIKATDYWGQYIVGKGKANDIDPPPTAINVTSVTYDASSMVVTWSESSDDDFVSYEVLHSSSGWNDKTSISTITDKATTSYSFTEFDVTKENWFWIKVIDYWGLNSIGDGMTSEVNAAPQVSEITSVYFENNSFIITWSENTDSDFSSYKLYEATSADMSDEAEIYSETSQATVSFTKTGVENDQRKYYRLVVIDNFNSKTTSSVHMGSSFLKIAFVSNRGDNTDIYIMDSDGVNQKRLTSSSEVEWNLHFSPDGEKIIFNQDNISIWVINIDGTGLQKLASDSKIWQNPFSPDGSLIVYTSDSPYEIFTMDVNGSNQSRLSYTSSSEYYPVFSPDQSLIAYIFSSDIWTMEINGNNKTERSSFYGSRSDISFLPDGSKLIYVYREYSFDEYEIYSINVDTWGNAIKLSTTGGPDYDPIISPDGSKIVFYSYADLDYEIYIMDADGSNNTNITNIVGTDAYPTFSPDGSKILFESIRDGNTEVYIMNIDGSNQTNLTNTSNAADYYPVFQPVRR